MQSEGYYSFEFLAGDRFSLQVDNITLASGQNLLAGAVLAKTFVGTAAGANAAGNTGNPTIGAITVGSLAETGLYLCNMLTATTYDLFSPGGAFLGSGTFGSSLVIPNRLTFTITAGVTPCIAGDAFGITVTEGATTYTASVTGSDAVALLGTATNATSGAVQTVAITRMAEFNPNEVSYGALTAGQILNANAALAKKLIIARGGM